MYSEKTSEYYLFNGRIDNREEIKKYLNINNSSLQDSEIFLNFFLKEGKKCLQKIHGSFAATIINNKSKSAICIKDHIGSKPLFFSMDKNYFIFSTNIQTITKIKKNKLQINYKRVEDYILYLHGSGNETFFKNISRLQRAEILSLEKNKIIIEKHHQLDSSKISPYKNIEEVQEAFSELFIRVIKEQSSDSKKIGSKLSGGIDSSSITSILCSETQNKIVSYSGIFTNLNKKDFELTDERKYMDSVIEKYNIEPRFVDIDTQKINPLAYLDDSNYSEVTPHANRYFEIIILRQLKKIILMSSLMDLMETQFFHMVMNI